jgi:hypothetical protein
LHCLLIELAELGVCALRGLVDPQLILQRERACLVEFRVEKKLIPVRHAFAQPEERIALLVERIPRCMRAQLRRLVRVCNTRVREGLELGFESLHR